MLPEFESAKALFSLYDLEVSRETYQKLEDYAAFLVAYNENVNLTAITDGDGILKKHFIDSLLLHGICKAQFPEGGRVLDIGSGAGFPGVPLALQRPDLRITLLDSLNKRIMFLQQLCEKLGLSYEAVHGRAEQLAKDETYREQFDFCVSRAVANLSVLSELCLPMVKVGGSFVSYKSGKADEEIAHASRAIRILGGKKARKEHLLLPGSDMERILVVVEKKEPTPKNFPRKAGIPAKKPIAS